MLKECVICGKVFNAKTRGTVCSVECRKERDSVRKMEYKKIPEVKEKARLYQLEYSRRPEVRLRHCKYLKEYRNRPEAKKSAQRRNRILYSAKKQLKNILAIQEALT